MYFNFFASALFISYFIFLYFFYVSAFRLIQLENQYAKPVKSKDDEINRQIGIILKVLMHLVIIFFTSLIVYFFILTFEPIYDSFTKTYAGISIFDWGNNSFYLILFGVLWLISLIFMLLYYALFGGYDVNNVRKKWHHKDVRSHIFDIPKIKRVYKIIVLALLGYFLLSFVQYHFYLNKISPYMAVDKYRHFLPTSYDRLAQEGTRRLNARYQGRYYDDVFNEVSRDWSSILIEQGEDIHTIQGMSLYNIKYQIVIYDLGALLPPNIWGGYSYCVVYLNFLKDGIFSEAETYCSKRPTFTITP